jgi:hypothetical protein
METGARQEHYHHTLCIQGHGQGKDCSSLTNVIIAGVNTADLTYFELDQLQRTNN